MKYRFLFLIPLLFFTACGPSNPATLNEVPAPGSGTLPADPFADPNAQLPGCILNFTSQISIAVDSAKTDVPHRQLEGAYTIPLRFVLPDHLFIRAFEFPKIIFPLSASDTGVGFDVDVVIDAGGSADTTLARGVLSSDGSMAIEGLNLRVRFFTAGQGSLASDSDPGVLQFTLPSVDLGTSLVTANLGNGSPLTATGFPLKGDGSLKLVLASAIPSEPQLAGSIGGGNVVAEFDGSVDQQPSSPNCQKGTIGGTPATGPAPRLDIQQLIGGTPTPLPTAAVDFGTVDVGGGRSSTVTLQLKNIGDAELAVSGLKLFDATIPFEVSSPTLSSLPPGGTSVFTVRFQPTIPVSGSPRRFETTLFVNSNDPLHPAKGLLLTGIGKPPSGEIKIVVNSPELVNPSEVDFGSVFFPTTATTPQQILKKFTISNAGASNLQIQGLDSLSGDYSIGLVRYGMNTSVLCALGKSPTVPADNCSVDAFKKLLSSNPSEREVLNFPAKSSVHLDAIVSYFPTDFDSPDEASFVVHPVIGSSKQVSLLAQTESNPAALLRVYMDKTPGAPGNDDLQILSDTQFSFGAVTDVALKIQNGGAAGGDRISIKNADITITGGGGHFTFTPASTSDQPSLVAPENLNDNRVVFGNLHYSPPTTKTVETATLHIVGHSVDGDGNERPGEIDYSTMLIAGAYDGNVIFKASRMIAGINNPALISKPSFADVDARIEMVLDPNNKSTAQLKKITSRAPNATEINAYRALNNSGRLAFMQTIAPLRLSTTSLGNGKDPPFCDEGNFDGVLGPNECSYFLVSIAGTGSDFSDPAKILDSDPILSDYKIDPASQQADLIFRDLTVRLLNPEHLLVTSIGPFDEKLRLSFHTGKIDPSFIFISPSAAWSPPLDLVNGSGVNRPPLQTYIDQDDNSDGLPGNRRGLLSGKILDFNTGHAVLAAVSKFSNSAPFFVQGAEIYIIIEGDFCGGNTGRNCD